MEFAADARWHAVSPGSFDQHAPRQCVAGLGDAAAPDGGAGGMFAGDQAEIGHQLSCIGEAAKVSDLGHDRNRDHQGDPAHCLESRDDGRHRPVRQQLLDLPRQPLEPGFGVLHSVNIILQHDLPCRMGKAYCRQPAPIGQRPGTNPAIDLVAQQEALQMLACLGQYPARRRPRPHQVVHSLVGGVRDPDRRQLAGTVRFG